MVSFWPAAVPFFWHLLLSASAAELASTFFDATMEPPQPAYPIWDSAADPNTTIHIAGRGQVVAPGTQAWQNSSPVWRLPWVRFVLRPSEVALT